MANSHAERYFCGSDAAVAQDFTMKGSPHMHANYVSHLLSQASIFPLCDEQLVPTRPWVGGALSDE